MIRCIIAGGRTFDDTTQPGSIAYVIMRRDLMTEGVWRKARGGQIGMNVRGLPY